MPYWLRLMPAPKHPASRRSSRPYGRMRAVQVGVGEVEAVGPQVARPVPRLRAPRWCSWSRRSARPRRPTVLPRRHRHRASRLPRRLPTLRISRRRPSGGGERPPGRPDRRGSDRDVDRGHRVRFGVSCAGQVSFVVPRCERSGLCTAQASFTTRWTASGRKHPSRECRRPRIPAGATCVKWR